jgi:hypothetical protein
MIQQEADVFDGADEAVRELRSALERVGVVLPSLGVDLVSCVCEPPRALVDLGPCNLETVAALAAALRAGAEG